MSLQTPKLNKSTKTSTLISKILIFAFAVGLGIIINAAWFRYDLGNNGFINRASRPSTSNLWEVYDILRAKYDGNFSEQDFMQGALRGSVASLNDPYTTFLSEAEARELADQLKGTLSGIGIEIAIKNDRLTVVAPIETTPADKAGLMAGDVIASIDGVNASTLSLDEAVKKIRGPAGTSVELTILREGRSFEVKIVRANITIQSVSVEQKDNNIGYIKIRDFGDNTNKQLQDGIDLLKSQGTRGLVIDLRDNPGGYLQTAVDVTSQFQQDGVVVVEKGKSLGEDKVFYANKSATLGNVPIVILINKGSASASEIVAGALRDNNRAILVGEQTFGKGVVQEIIDLSGASKLKVTVAKWFTPKGVNISEKGIAPDLFVAPSDNSEVDTQLEAAIEQINKKI